MNEKMNRREAELNDAALEGVSGGVSDALRQRVWRCLFALSVGLRA